MKFLIQSILNTIKAKIIPGLKRIKCMVKRISSKRKHEILSVFKNHSDYCCSVTQSCPTLATPWTAACLAFLSSITNSRSLLKLMSIESVMPSNHFVLCHPLHLLPSIFPIIRVFSNEAVLRIRWPKCWSFSFSISPSNECSGLISF